MTSIIETGHKTMEGAPMDQLQPREWEPSVKNVKAFVQAARARVVPGIVCVDGGVKKTVTDTKGNKVEYTGMVGYPGADMAMLSAEVAYNQQQGIEFTPDDLAKKIVDATIEVHGQYHLHTDTHAHHQHKVTGCGHEQGQCVEEFATDYGVDPQVMTAINTQVQEHALTNPKIINQNLDREHQELGVLANTGETHTVTHWVTPEEFPGLDTEVYGQYFGLDDKHSKLRFRAVWEKLNYSPEKVTALESILDNQAKVTYRRLAIDKPVYGYNADKEIVDVSFLGWVQSDGSIALTPPKVQ